MKRATGINSKGDIIKGISIHALVKRATQIICRFAHLLNDFNPRPREEGDALTTVFKGVMEYFNPRPREEGDAVAHTGTVSDVDFNPRPREEGDVMLATMM